MKQRASKIQESLLKFTKIKFCMVNIEWSVFTQSLEKRCNVFNEQQWKEKYLRGYLWGLLHYDNKRLWEDKNIKRSETSERNVKQNLHYKTHQVLL